ncbi:MAG: iojap-like protein [Verrucomicrobia bacterium]|nr:iojap-like protein [Verrucomicrobiota bacterium]
MKGKNSNSIELVKLCCRALEEKKAGDLRVLDVSEQSSITDYLVLATGTSDPHLRALRVELEKAIDESRNRIVGMETSQESGWLVVDIFDVMVHIFTRENRSKYGLENLWKDAVEISVPDLFAPPKAAATKTPKAPKAAKIPKAAKAEKKPARPAKASKAPAAKAKKTAKK